MPPCDKKMRILRGRDGDVVFEVNCIDSAEHGGEHQGHVWVDLPNTATGKIGVIKTIFF